MNQMIETVINKILEKKGEDVTLYDTKQAHPLADYILVVSAQNIIHISAIQTQIQAITKKSKPSNSHPLHPTKWFGVPESEWIIIDLDVVLIHIMTKEMRLYYSMNDLFSSFDAHTYH